MKQQIEMVVFDMAGTTIQDKNEVEACFLEAVRQTGLQATHDEINAMMGWSKVTVFETLWNRQLAGASPAEISERVQSSYDLFRQVLENHYRKAPILPTEGTLELFGFLKSKQVKIALGTGFYREVTDIILGRLGWDEGFDANYAGSGLINASVSSDQVFAARPAPFMVFRAMELCGVNDVRRIIKIGDTPSDLAGGKNAGCFASFGVTNGTHRHEPLAAIENEGLFANMNEFQVYLEQLLA